METEINIVEILKDKPANTKLYSPLFSEVFFSHVSGGYIAVEHHGGTSLFLSSGRFYDYDGSMIIEDIINEKCVTFMTEEPMDNIQSAEYFKENILPNEVEITHDDGNYFEVSVNCKSYSCDVYGNGDFYHSIAEFKLLED